MYWDQIETVFGLKMFALEYLSAYALEKSSVTW